MVQDFYINENIFLENSTFKKDLIIEGDLSFTTLSATSAVVIDTDSSQPALRVTQRGTGDVIVVEDSSNPDASCFAVNAEGNLRISRQLTFGSDPNTVNSYMAGIKNSNNNFIIGFDKNVTLNLDETFPLLSFTLSDGTFPNYTSLGTGNSYDLVLNVVENPLGGGNVGIDTTSPNEKLTVIGNISATGNIFGNFPPNPNAIDTEVRGLTGNWQNTYNTVRTTSADWNNAYNNTKFLNIITHSGSNYTALDQHSGKVVHIDTSSGPLTAFFNLPLSDGFNVGLVLKGNNSLTIKSSNGTIESLGTQLIFNLDKALIYKEPITNNFIALGDLI